MYNAFLSAVDSNLDLTFPMDKGFSATDLDFFEQSELVIQQVCEKPEALGFQGQAVQVRGVDEQLTGSPEARFKRVAVQATPWPRPQEYLVPLNGIYLRQPKEDNVSLESKYSAIHSQCPEIFAVNNWGSCIEEWTKPLRSGPLETHLGRGSFHRTSELLVSEEKPRRHLFFDRGHVDKLNFQFFKNLLRKKCFGSSNLQQPGMDCWCIAHVCHSDEGVYAKSCSKTVVSTYMTMGVDQKVPEATVNFVTAQEEAMAATSARQEDDLMRCVGCIDLFETQNYHHIHCTVSSHIISLFCLYI